MRKIPAIAAFLVLGPTGCSLVATDEERVVGIIAINGTSEFVLLAPDEVASGRPASVVVSTYRRDCMIEEGARVERSPNGVRITPFDRRLDPGSGEACQVGDRLPRTVEVTFEQPGEATITIVGRELLTDSTGRRTRRTILEETILVR